MGHEFSESERTFYHEHLCSKSDQAFQFAYTLTVDRATAVETVNKVYKKFAGELPTPGDDETELTVILQEVWKQVLGGEEKKPAATEHKVFRNLYGNLSLEERAVLTLKDFFGLQDKDVLRLLQIKEQQLKESLAEGRKRLLSAEF